MRVVSWNVNGLRACAKKGFAKFLESSNADVVGIQEVRADPAQLDPETCFPQGWQAYFAPAVRPGYSGVAIYSRVEPDDVQIGVGEKRFDDEGRLITARFGELFIVNGYFPKGSGKDRDNSRVPYKLDFYRAVFERVQRLRKRGQVLVIGDFNTAHEEIDLARPKDNAKTSGFLPEEREEFSRWIAAGWVDTFRVRHPGENGHYTWWRQWGGARERNIGWRIDYVLACPAAAARVRDAFIWPQVMGSDHCPAGVDLD
ncbi:MAG: exodeoxyribonuclease III [Gammaproteobacteria bacterium]|nr:exodeoxyribonuclease III [Gammaproteobacteria bacterium]